MLLMYIHDFFRSLTLLQSSYQFIDERFFIDKDYVQEIDCLQLTENNLDPQKGNHNLIYINQKHPEKYETECLDDLYQYMHQLSHLQMTIPASKAIYLEAGILEAIYLYDSLWLNSSKAIDSQLLLPLLHLHNLFCQCPQNNKNDFPKTYMIECLQQLYILRFYYFIIQYCYVRFQCQKYHTLTHPHHFHILVQNKLRQYIKERPIQHIQDLTFLDNPILDQYISSLEK